MPVLPSSSTRSVWGLRQVRFRISFASRLCIVAVIIITTAADRIESLAVYKPPSPSSAGRLNVSLFAFWQRWCVFPRLARLFMPWTHVAEGMHYAGWNISWPRYSLVYLFLSLARMGSILWMAFLSSLNDYTDSPPNKTPPANGTRILLVSTFK